MGACHPMATLKYTDSVTSFPVNIISALGVKIHREFIFLFQIYLAIFY